MKKINLISLSKLLICISLVSFIGCAELANDPYYRSGGGGGYNDPYYGGGYKDSNRYDRELERTRRDRYELERERDRAQEERIRLERERNSSRQVPVYRPQPRQESCPSGFSPSEQKCSTEERRRGCKDMRLPGGLGCVRR